MTRLTPKIFAATAVSFITGALAFSCLAGVPQNQTNPQNDSLL